MTLPETPHRRYNALTGEWVLVSPHRSKRPWQGQVEKTPGEYRPEYDPTCYLCPGNSRAGNAVNPAYVDTFVFDNDFSALLDIEPVQVNSMGDIFRVAVDRGICRVICYSPRHDLTIPEMETENIKKVIDLWCDEFNTLGQIEYINYVQIFENKGAMMGCSNPHPHGQIWASELIPGEIQKETKMQGDFYKKHQNTLLFSYLEKEIQNNTRIICKNSSFIALVPFWAVWPYEALVVSKRPVANIIMLSDKEKSDLADIYQQLTIRYDNLFEVSFPYSAGLHQAPTDGKEHPEWHLHMHFYPPLLRSATVKKFMVGYELLASPQRDITPEAAALALRSASKLHYKKNY